MAGSTRADERVGATESKFYLPAETTLSFVAGRLERLWARLFDHGVEISE